METLCRLWPRLVFVGLVLLIGSLLSTQRSSDAADLPGGEFQVTAGQRKLFLDDHGIATINNLRRTMHQPTKRGAVIRPDKAWETSLQTRSAPAWDPEKKVFKIWLITSTNVPGLAGTTYAESKDGIHWTKPSLEQLVYGVIAEIGLIRR